MNKDVVVEDPKVESQTTTDDTGAQTDESLDTILSNIDKDFEESTKETTPEPKKDEDNAELSARVEAIEVREQNFAIKDAVSIVQGQLNGLDVSVPDKVVDALLNKMAGDDKRMMDAFQNREVNPRGWEKVLEGASKEIAKEFDSQPDKQLTGDRESVASLVRGSKTAIAEDEPLNMNLWSDNRFNHWKQTGKDNPEL